MYIDKIRYNLYLCKVFFLILRTLMSKKIQNCEDQNNMTIITRANAQNRKLQASYVLGKLY